jgi:hypothetical protein
MAAIDENRVRFTAHALDQFTERFRVLENGVVLKEPETTARKLLAHAEEERLGPLARVKRLLNNRGVPVRYFTSSGWRFVIKEEDERFVVLTIERNTFPKRRSR